MSGKGLICKLGKHSPIEGADFIVEVKMFGETIITQKKNLEGKLGILFDCDTQLTSEFCSNNNLFKKKELNKDQTISGYFEDNCRIRPLKFKNVKCSAFWMPEECLSYIGKVDLIEGAQIDSIGEYKICNKYINPEQKGLVTTKGLSLKKSLVPGFLEHFDTDQFSRNLESFKEGDVVIVTEKLHGTSGRCGYLKVDKYSLISKPKLFLDKLLNAIRNPELFLNWYRNKPSYMEYDLAVGSRRVIKYASDIKIDKNDYYAGDIWTEAAKKNFEGKLKKGEVVYFEIVGYYGGSPIMPSCSNSKLQKFLDEKEYNSILKKYGEVTNFTYNCNITNYEVYVYRITSVNEDNDFIEYSWEQVKKRCDQMGVNHVPEIARFLVKDKDSLEKRVLRMANSAGSFNHISEGVCVRNDSRLYPVIFKEKSYLFKVLENIIKDTQTNIEESA